MTKKPDEGKIKGVKSTKETTQVERTENVTSVTGVKSATSIGAIGGATAIGARRPTRTMTLEEREELFRLINEEADKMLTKSGLSKEKIEIVQNAVKMAVDSGLMSEDDSDDEDDHKKKKK